MKQEEDVGKKFNRLTILSIIPKYKCNRKKSSDSYEEFITWVKKIYENHN